MKKLLLFMCMAILVACGSDNQSGNPPAVGNPGFAGGIGAGGFGNYNVGVTGGQFQNLNQVLAAIGQFHPCTTNNFGYPGQYPTQYQQQIPRQGIQQRVRMTVNIPQQRAMYLTKPSVGITYEGDIAVMYQTAGQAMMDVYACPRAQMTQAGLRIIAVNPPLPNTQCPVEGLVASLQMDGSMYPTQFRFYPITENFQLYQSVCR